VSTFGAKPDEEGEEVRFAVSNIAVEIDEFIREVVLAAQSALRFSEELSPNLPSISAERFPVICHRVGMERRLDEFELMTIHAPAIPQQGLVNRQVITVCLVTRRYQDDERCGDSRRPVNVRAIRSS
jgi:hypothetical protein